MPLFEPKEINWSIGEAFTIMNENQAELDRIDAEAKGKGQLLWRYIQEPYADGQAVYQIIKVNKVSVRIRTCTGLGDDWMIPYWGEEASIALDYAESKVQHRDNIAEFFASKQTDGV